ncbi:hypothetical protein Pla22_39750 [Rubripirellula amarantea]|uniref:Type II secretion system protein GspF domain-containing protein n=1 Tax=Rubripirellula amarantea TaxID=2527999 RepID=A0A5C5WK91_9BACT|nr:hypothetical protein [Rubripirellula amarantea]TWT51198.1 hypothetical protein Pla22_39750 [Rubripirellula amarantea]
MINRPIRIAIWVIALLGVLSVFTFIFPSLMGWILSLLTFSAIFEYKGHRFRHTVQSFNDVLESVARHGGDVTSVAVSFSRKGPLSGRCYEFARRLMMGQEPLEAAARARVPLQLSTAVALQGGMQQADDGEAISTDLTRTDLIHGNLDQSLDRYRREVGSSVNGVGRNLYLFITVLVALLVTSFLEVFVRPTIVQLLEEFEIGDPKYIEFLTTTPISLAFVAMAAFFLVIRPVLRRGRIGKLKLPRWIPESSTVARNQSQLLHGLADAVDSGWPIGRALTVAHVIAIDPGQRNRLQQAMEWIEQGKTPGQAIAQAGWIDNADVPWIDGAAPSRITSILRMIGDRNLRDSMIRRGWINSILFPVCIFTLAALVGTYAVGFMQALMELINYGAIQ